MIFIGFLWDLKSLPGFLCVFFFFVERRRKLDEKNLIWLEVWELLGSRFGLAMSS